MAGASAPPGQEPAATPGQPFVVPPGQRSEAPPSGTGELPAAAASAVEQYKSAAAAQGVSPDASLLAVLPALVVSLPTSGVRRDRRSAGWVTTS